MFDNLPLGFRFKPTDVELIDHYLRLKINGKNNEVSCIREVDICKVEPWDLPDMAAIKTCDPEWYFFCPRDPKYQNSLRTNRATEAGYWKATGKDRNIKSRTMGLIGMKKTLVFHTGRAPKGKRTNWVIHEYRPTIQELDGTNQGQDAFVLCRLFKKFDDLKQDENDNVSNVDEVETPIFSPDNINISQEVTHPEPVIEQATPVSVEQPVVQASPAIDDSFSDFRDFNFLTDAPPIHQDNPFCLDDQEDMLKVADLIGWNESCNWPDIEGLQFPDASDFTGCKTSLSNQPSSSEQPSQNYGFANDDNTLSDDSLHQFWKSNVPTENKIQTRSNYRQRDLQPTNIVPQGTASRRIHLNLVDDNDGQGFDYDDYLCLDELTGTPPEAEEEKLCINDDQVVETGIKLTSHLRKTKQSRSILVEEETAPMRIRLRRSFVKSYNAEEQVDEEEDDNKPLVPELIRVDLSNQKRRLYKWMISVFLVMACIGLWRARNIVYS